MSNNDDRPVLRIRTTYVNNYSALHTAEIVEGWHLVAAWLESRGLEPQQVVRKYRVNKRGRVTFKHGCGYSILDADLLGGTGDGQALRQFQDAHPKLRIIYP